MRIRVKFAWDIEPGFQSAREMFFINRPDLSCEDIFNLIPLPEDVVPCGILHDGFTILIDNNGDDEDWCFETASVDEKYFIDVWYALVTRGLVPLT